LSSPPVIVIHAGVPVYEPGVGVVVGAFVMAMLIDPVIEARAGSVVVASSAPRADSNDACDCKASISPDTVVFSHMLRMFFMISSN
jgi:hypothetical protein